MDAALHRARLATGTLRSFDDVRRADDATVLLVTAPGCEHCAAFETDYRATAEQVAATTFNAAILPWACTTAVARDVAMQSGVDDVPSIVVVPSKKSGDPIVVRDAFAFAREENSSPSASAPLDALREE